jgi:hypothetical protein
LDFLLIQDSFLSTITYMEQLLSSFPTWVGTIAFMVVGFLAVLGIVDWKTRERAKETKVEQDTLQENIRKLYKEESAAQDEKIKSQALQIGELSDRLKTVESENSIMKSLLLSTDEKSVAYRARMEKKTDDIMIQMQTVNQNIQTLAEAIQKKNQ